MAVEAEPADARLVQLEEQLSKLTAMVSRLVEDQKPADKLLRRDAPDLQLEAFRKAKVGGDPVRRSKVTDLRDPFATQSGFQVDDFVTVKDSSAKYDNYWLDAAGDPIYSRENGVLPEGATQAIGIVLSYMYTKQHGAMAGQRKYKVQFQGFGKDGLCESELELCRR